MITWCTEETPEGAEIEVLRGLPLGLEMTVARWEHRDERERGWFWHLRSPASQAGAIGTQFPDAHTAKIQGMRAVQLRLRQITEGLLEAVDPESTVRESAVVVFAAAQPVLQQVTAPLRVACAQLDALIRGDEPRAVSAEPEEAVRVPRALILAAETALEREQPDLGHLREVIGKMGNAARRGAQ